MQLYVLTNEALNELYLRAGAPDGLKAYLGLGPIPIPPDWTLASPLKTAGPVPNLVPAKDDVENAIRLYKWLRPTSDRDARDNRLWTWLAHYVFADYCRARWPISSDLPDVESIKEATNSVRSHWILRGEGRGAVVRHALARLWWAAHATYEPWKWSLELGYLQKNDPFHYTRILLRYQNINLQIRDRRLGSNNRILIAAIEALDIFGVQMEKGAAWLGRELTLVGRYRSLDRMPFRALVDLCTSLLSLPGAPGQKPPHA